MSYQFTFFSLLITVRHPKYIPKVIKAQLSDLFSELDETDENARKGVVMSQREKMNDVNKTILRRKMEKEQSKMPKYV